MGAHRAIVVVLAVVTGCIEPAPLCLSDSFDERELDTLRWQKLGEAPLMVANGSLLLTAPVGVASAVAGITSTQLVSLDGGAVEVGVPVVLPPDTNTIMKLSIIVQDGVDALAIEQTNNVLVLSDLGGQDLSVPADPTTDAWRIRDDTSAAMIVYETHANTGEWTSQRTVAARSLSSAFVRLEVDVTGLAKTGGTASFDNLVVDQGTCTSPDTYRSHTGPYAP